MYLVKVGLVEVGLEDCMYFAKEVSIVKSRL